MELASFVSAQRWNHDTRVCARHPVPLSLGDRMEHKLPCRLFLRLRWNRPAVGAAGPSRQWWDRLEVRSATCRISHMSPPVGQWAEIGPRYAVIYCMHTAIPVGFGVVIT